MHHAAAAVIFSSSTHARSTAPPLARDNNTQALNSIKQSRASIRTGTAKGRTSQASEQQKTVRAGLAVSAAAAACCWTSDCPHSSSRSPLPSMFCRNYKHRAWWWFYWKRIEGSYACDRLPACWQQRRQHHAASLFSRSDSISFFFCCCFVCLAIKRQTHWVFDMFARASPFVPCWTETLSHRSPGSRSLDHGPRSSSSSSNKFLQVFVASYGQPKQTSKRTRQAKTQAKQVPTWMSRVLNTSQC
jgi:hypothetical protein